MQGGSSRLQSQCFGLLPRRFSLLYESGSPTQSDQCECVCGVGVGLISSCCAGKGKNIKI
jgi:hypothetical protein